jgi:hypothetical protein
MFKESSYLYSLLQLYNPFLGLQLIMWYIMWHNQCDNVRVFGSSADYVVYYVA